MLSVVNSLNTHSTLTIAYVSLQYHSKIEAITLQVITPSHLTL